jgi:hypothetical protein
MPKRLIAANVILAGLAVFFVVQLVRDLSRQPSLPPPRAPRPASTAAAAPPVGLAPAEALTSYNVIPAKSLFSPSRGEGSAAEAPAVPLPPKPVLLGVVVDEPRSLAYLEDPVSKRIFAYRVGDTVAGGRLEQIAVDRVMILRSDGKLDVLLADPAKLPVGPAQPGGPAPPAVRPVRPAGSPPAVRAPRVLPNEPAPEAPPQAPQQ